MKKLNECINCGGAGFTMELNEVESLKEYHLHWYDGQRHEEKCPLCVGKGHLAMSEKEQKLLNSCLTENPKKSALINIIRHLLER